MFALAIRNAATATVSTHPNREVAHAELVAYAEATGHRLHVAYASWTHSRYHIAIGKQIDGHAVIDELCGCDHAERQHDETGCTAMTPESGRLSQCGCTQHQPVCEEPTLFTPRAST